LQQNLKDARRAIEVTKLSHQTDQILKSNLIKLNAFISYLDKDHVKAFY
jgi:hypothetical protein